MQIPHVGGLGKSPVSSLGRVDHTRNIPTIVEKLEHEESETFAKRRDDLKDRSPILSTK